MNPVHRLMVREQHVDPRLEGSEMETDIPPDVLRGLGQITRPGGLLRAAWRPQTGSDGKPGREPGALPRDGQTGSSPGSGSPRNQQWAPACPPAHPFCWDIGSLPGKLDAR